MSWRLTACVIALALVAPTLAHAQGVCSKLRVADQKAQPFDDQEYNSSIEYRENDQVVKTFKLRVITKGMHKMLINFLAPGDVRGMRVLIVDPETMYTYLPQFRRVRRVAANARNQGFMGTNITNEDMSEHRYSDRWNCRPHKTTSEAWILDLTPKSGTTTQYSKMRVWVGRKRGQYEKIHYFVDGRHKKSQLRSQWRTLEGLEMASRIRYVSEDRPVETRIKMDSWRVNTGVSDRAFTRRALLRGD